MEQNEKKAKIIGERIKYLRENATCGKMRYHYERAQKTGVPIQLGAQAKNTLYASKENSKVSQETLAAILGKSRSTIDRCERGELGKKGEIKLKDTDLALFARLVGVCVPYIIGETDIADPMEYELQLDREEDEALTSIEEYRLEQIRQYETLFKLCGFQYENIEYNPEYMRDAFCAFFEDAPYYGGPHKLTEQNAAGDAVALYLSDDELEKLKERLYDTVAFECFCIKRGRDKDNGNG